MVADYNLSNLPADQAEIWLWARSDEIRGQIMTAQAERLGLPLPLSPLVSLTLREKPHSHFTQFAPAVDAVTSCAENEEV
jgi:hypothetical protein